MRCEVVCLVPDSTGRNRTLSDILRTLTCSCGLIAVTWTESGHVRCQMRQVNFDQTVKFLAPLAFVENAKDAAERDGQTLSEFYRSAISAKLKANGVVPGVRQRQANDEAQDQLLEEMQQ